jgi:hypothetical protein
VAKESAKWRSGRDGDRPIGPGPSARGKKSADPLGDHKGVATEHDGDVVVPSDEASSFVVVESELSLELLINAFGLPPLLDGANDLLFAHSPAQVGEEELGGSTLAVGPFDDEPYRLTEHRLAAVVVCGFDASEDEPGAELVVAARAVAPGELAERTLAELASELPYFDGLRVTSVLVEQPDVRIGIDGHRIVEALATNEVTKDVRPSVEASANMTSPGMPSSTARAIMSIANSTLVLKTTESGTRARRRRAMSLVHDSGR